MIVRVLRKLLFFLFRIKIVGELQLKGDRNIIIANHQSFLDGLILGLALPISPIFVINTQIAQRPIINFLLKLSDYLVIDPTNPMGIKTIIRLIEHGKTVVIFPEGRITTTGGLMKIYEGGAFVAAKTGANILPVIINGAHFSPLSRMPQEHPRQWLPQITLTYCVPQTLNVDHYASSSQQHAAAGEAMRVLMQHSIYESRTSSTLFNAFLNAMKEYGPKRRVLEDTKLIEYSYKDLLKMSLALGRLVSKHTQTGETVGILMPTAVPTLALLLGFGAFGRIPAMLNFTAGVDSLKSSCAAACVHTIITSRAFIEQAKIENKIEALKSLTIVYLEDLKTQFTLFDKLWLMGYALHFPKYASCNQIPQATATVLFTSGSEGLPKGVVLSHNSLLANIAQIRSMFDLSTDDKVLNVLPMFHSFGLTAGTLLPLFGGMKIFLYPSPLHYKTIPEVAYDRSCTVLLGTNSFLGQYAQNAHVYDFYNLRYVVAGAEKLSQNVRDLWFEKFGLRIFEGYGATEAAPVIAVNSKMAYKSGTVGQLLPGISHILTSVEGIDEGGVLHVRGGNLMSGYLRSTNPGILEKPSSSVGEGWYDTGDIVTIDNEGYVRIIGRVKRFAKIAGEMVSLESVEILAQNASPDFIHAASSKNDENRGETIILFTTDPNLKRDILIKSAKSLGFAEITVPKKIQYVTDIPLLGTGKTDYVTLKAMASELT
jgi:acyl-[acyl-carrier-protein]-phospholipid O-acyltransferase/long-chain-fatty-acid--[acyl-carrier-protein] ligase